MRILLIQLKRIGDLVLTTPAMVALRARLPEAEITAAISAWCREMAPALPGKNRVVVVDRNFGWARLAGRHFDYAIDFTRNDRSAWLSFTSAAHERVVSDRVQKSRWRAALYNRPVESPVQTLHTSEHYLRLLQPLGIQEGSTQPRLELPGEAIEEAARLRQGAQAGSDYLVFHAGSARPEKFWVPERWAELIRRAQAAFSLPIFLTGGPSLMETTHAAAIAAARPGRYHDLTGKISLLTLAALIREARLLVTIDSAAMHFGSAFGTPQVALFGPTNPFHWRPLGSEAAVISAASPVPLTSFVPGMQGAPMSQISTEGVFNAMETLLSAPSARPPL